MAIPPIDFNEFFGGLYPVYVRGEAYLAAQRGDAAAVEFQKILDHRGIVAGDPIGALARLQIARAYLMQEYSLQSKKKTTPEGTSRTALASSVSVDQYDHGRAATTSPEPNNL